MKPREVVCGPKHPVKLLLTKLSIVLDIVSRKKAFAILDLSVEDGFGGVKAELVLRRRDFFAVKLLLSHRSDFSKAVLLADLVEQFVQRIQLLS